MTALLDPDKSCPAGRRNVRTRDIPVPLSCGNAQTLCRGLWGELFRVHNKHGNRTAPESVARTADWDPGPNRPHLSERGSAVSIMLPSDAENDNPPPNGKWRANDITPAEVAHCAARFAKYYEAGAEDECWLWSGAAYRSGYGAFGIGHNKSRIAHRVAWVLASGRALTDGLTIDHLCNQPLCVNPRHLEPVTVRENIRRRSERRGWAIGQDESDARRRVKNLEWYYANREAVLARSTELVQCEACDKKLRRGSLRSHKKRLHDEAA